MVEEQKGDLMQKKECHFSGDFMGGSYLKPTTLKNKALVGCDCTPQKMQQDMIEVFVLKIDTEHEEEGAHRQLP